jgi:molybdenum cofactor cytidylyltransferase
MVSAVVVAAGESKRMGQTKLLLPLEGKAILQWVLDNLGRSQVEEVILVLGHEADRVLRTVDTRNVKVVINRNYREGMITSIEQGLRNLNDKVEAFFIVLADQPGVSLEVFNRLITEFRQIVPQKNIVLPTFCGRKGHPALFGVKYRKEASRIRGDVGLRQILQEHPEDILEVEMDTDSILQDIDTPDDYLKHLKSSSTGKDP